MTSREQLILLNTIPDVSAACLRRLFEAFGGLSRLGVAAPEELQQVQGVSPILAHRLFEGLRDEARLVRELSLAARAGVTMLTLEDAGYPDALKTLPDPPLALYVRGELTAADASAVGIVGARRASLYGIRCAEQLGHDLALRGLTVVSGLARGIDAAAHEGALKAPGRTIAVLGNGLSRVYPPEHAPLADRIAEHGAVVSEYPMETAPLSYNFPRRNRIISGLSLGVVVVEAAQRSGALITADCALEQGREVFAVPGPMTAVTSQGTHQLVKQGARLVTSVEDILDELGFSEPVARPARKTAAAESLAAGSGFGPERNRRAEPDGLAGPEQRVFGCVREGQPEDIDAIVAKSGLETSEVSSLLLQLELKRLVRQLPGKQFVRC